MITQEFNRRARVIKAPLHRSPNIWVSLGWALEARRNKHRRDTYFSTLGSSSLDLLKGLANIGNNDLKSDINLNLSCNKELKK